LPDSRCRYFRKGASSMGQSRSSGCVSVCLAENPNIEKSFYRYMPSCDLSRWSLELVERFSSILRLGCRGQRQAFSLTPRFGGVEGLDYDYNCFNSLRNPSQTVETVQLHSSATYTSLKRGVNETLSFRLRAGPSRDAEGKLKRGVCDAEFLGRIPYESRD